MGAYLSQPVTAKESEDGAGGGLRYGVSSMQGWRVNMEDAHITQPELIKGSNVGLFAVFDGHGGKEVASFCAKYFPEELKAAISQDKPKLDEVLPKVFHRMDSMLREERFACELQLLSKNKEEAAKAEASGAAAGGGAGGQGQAATMVRTSINSSLDEARKKGKLTQKEAMELMVKMMTLQRMENKAGGTAEVAVSAGRADDSNTCAGCTANVVVVTAKEILVANAGDSRTIVSREGHVTPLSKDHKPNLPEERQRIEAAGGWITDGASGHYRVNGNLNLSRSIGDLKYKTNTSLPPEQQVVTAHPDVVRHPRSPEDEFLVIACDGVWDCMTNEEVGDFTRRRLEEGAKCSEICEEIFIQCLAEDPKTTAGIGGDNMTCVIVDLKQR